MSNLGNSCDSNICLLFLRRPQGDFQRRVFLLGMDREVLQEAFQEALKVEKVQKEAQEEGEQKEEEEEEIFKEKKTERQ